MVNEMPDEEQEGYDDHGNELNLTRRSKHSGGGTPQNPKKGGDPKKAKKAVVMPRANAPGTAAPLQ
jgi:hypothetical protein